MTAGLLATDPVALGPYRLLGRLGGGGMGQVFLARSAGGRLVAVKVIRPEFAADPEFRARFTREVANAKNVSGMFTAVLVGADTEGPVPWLATAYIPGPPLSAAVRESGPLPLASVLPLAAGLTEALAAIHAAGVVHRDLKPSNVLLASDGPRVIDFGISQAMEASALTQTGAILGSPGYMSPEQAQGLPVGPASDVFSLGAMLAFAATGAGPFGGGSVAALVYRVVSEAPDLGQVPPELRPLIERCLAKAPGDRPGLADLLSEFGGEVIAENWLPETIADTFPRYEPSARIAELAAGKAPLTDAPAAEIRAPETQAPGTPAPEPPGPQTTGSGKQAPATPATGMPATGAPEPEAPGGAATTWTGRAGPPAGRTSLPALLCRPWPRRRGRAVTAVVAVTIAAIVAGWLTLGTDALGGHAGGRAQSLVPVGASAPPTSATRTGGIIAAGGGPGSPKAPVTSHRPTPTVSTSRARPVRPTQQPSPASAATAAAAVHNPAPPASTAAPTPAAHRSSSADSPPVTSSTGALSATNGTTYSCSDHPIAGASSTSASYEWVNNSASTEYIYYTETSFFAGYTGTVPAHSSVGSTIYVGGTYLVQDGTGNCLGAVTINATTGTVTLS